MARRRATTAATETTAAPAETPAAPPAGAEGAETVVRRRRRRRTSAPDYASETAQLVDAALKSRGAKGATQEALLSVVNWARTVRAEGESLRELAGRPRRQKAQAPLERLTRYEMNRALLEGVLAGTIALDIEEDGTLVFLDKGATSETYEDVEPDTTTTI